MNINGNKELRNDEILKHWSNGILDNRIIGNLVVLTFP
jgi:hypothetical protein